jgi:single-strand DNA-binding protein
MSNSMFNYDQSQGVSAGVSNYVSESGAYAGRILTAEWSVAKTGTKGIEITFETTEGLKANYLSLWYEKADRTQLSGAKMLNAIMGCTKVASLNSKAIGQPDGSTKYFCPELENKSIGLILQKVLYTKNDNSDGYKFEIRIPFIPQNNKTLAEQLGNKDAVTVSNILKTLTDKDDRTQGGNQSSGQSQSQGYDNGVQDFAGDDGWGDFPA